MHNYYIIYRLKHQPRDDVHCPFLRHSYRLEKQASPDSVKAAFIMVKQVNPGEFVSQITSYRIHDVRTETSPP